MSASTSWTTLRAHYAAPEVAARRARAAGTKVVGSIGDAMPIELVRAAGLHHVRLKGDPRGSTAAAEIHYVPRFTTRDGCTASILERLLSGELDFLDHLVIVHDRDAIHRLYPLLRALRARDFEAPLPDVHLLDWLHTSTFATSAYEHGQLRRLRSRLEVWSGSAITDGALHTTLVATNRSRELVRALDDRRGKGTISGADALTTMGAFFAMRPEDFDACVEDPLARSDSPRPEPGVPTFVAGSPWDHPGLYDALADAGLHVVGEHSGWGRSAFEGEIAPDGDPFDAIADHYHRRPPSSRMFPMSRNLDHVVERAKASGAHCAVIAVSRGDRAEAWEAPAKLERLRRAGIPSLHLPDVPYDVAPREPLLRSLEDFARELRAKGTP